MRRAIFFDRDGVLNHLVERDGGLVSPRTMAEFRLYDDAPAAVAAARELGFLTLVITNQPDVARGTLDRHALGTMTDAVRALGVDDVAICPHDDAARCACRKPKPGMLLDLAQAWDVDLARSYVIGDTWRDMDAGRGAGCHLVLLDRGGGGATAQADVRVADLREAVSYIQSREQQDAARG